MNERITVLRGVRDTLVVENERLREKGRLLERRLAGIRSALGPELLRRAGDNEATAVFLLLQEFAARSQSRETG